MEIVVYHQGSFLFRRLGPACLFLLVAFLSSPAHAQPAAEKPVAFATSDVGLQWGPCPSIFPAGCTIAVLHGDPTQPNADVFLKVPPGYVIPPHWHTSPERMVLVSGELKVRYEGHEPFVLRLGTYAYGPAKAPHDATCTSSGPCVLFIAFESPVDAHATEETKK